MRTHVFYSIPLSLGEAGGRCVLIFGIYYCVAFFFVVVVF